MRPAVWLSGGSCGRSRAFPQGLPGGRTCDRRCATACGQTAGRRFIRPRAGMCFRMRDRLNTAQSKGHFPKTVSFPPGVAAFGAVLVACGFGQALSGPYLRPTFAPKRQGKAESAYRRPRLRPSFGQRKGIGLPMPCRVGDDRSIPNRRTKQEQSQARLNYVLQGGGRVALNPFTTDFCVLKDTARCPLSNSKGFGLLPKRPCPSRGGLPLRSREACFHLRCGCRSYAYAVTPLNPL